MTILSIRTTVDGVKVCNTYTGETPTSKLSFLDAVTLGCIGNGTRLIELENRINEVYPMTVTTSDVINKVRSLEERHLVSVIRTIEDDTILFFNSNGICFKSSYRDFVLLNPKIDISIIKEELPYKPVVGLGPNLAVRLA